MKSTFEQTSTGPVFKYEDGTEFQMYATGGRVTFPASGDVGSFSFPVRQNGDVFNAFKMFDGRKLSASLIPKSCRAW